MITLTIGNSYSRIQGLSAVDEKKLRILLSYTVGGSSAYYSGFGIRKKSLLDKKGHFPTGLVHRVKEYLDFRYTFVDNRIKPIYKPQGAILGIKPYQWQEDAVSAAIVNPRGIITAPTGTGKSLAMGMLIKRLNLKTLIVVPTLEIKKQLTEAFTFMGLKNITIENIDSKKLKTLKNFDVLMIDEAHHVASKTYRNLNKTAWNGIYHRYFWTATPFRNDTEEQLLFESIAGRVIYKLDYKTSITENYIVPVEAYYIEIHKQNTDAYSYAEVYKELVVQNVPRNVAICKLLTNLYSAGKSTLCLVKEVKHGKILSEMTGLPFISGEDDKSRKYIRQFSARNIMAVIATTGVMGEGIDTKACEYVVVAGLGKAKSQFMQQVGRAVRKYPGKESAKVIIFKDKSHKFCLRHFNTQVKILKEEYGVICQELKL